ncbi:MAG TPA: type II secretion system protein [Gaiellaceae bacterium]
MGIRIREESGFGLLELLIAMVVLNVGLFAVVGVFNGATVAMGRASTISAATAVADKQMEIYRSLQNCAIWLDPSSFPTINSGSPYQADTSSYMNVYAFNPGPPLPINFTPAPVPFFDNSQNDPTFRGTQPWATSATSSVLYTQWSGDIPTSCTPTPGVTPPTPATLAIQNIKGPNGLSYLVYTYIVLIQSRSKPNILVGQAGYFQGAYAKQLTVVVRDPRTPAKILARETSLFDPLNG